MPGRQIFYTHVMKTGGTSLGKVLRAQFEESLTYPSDESDRAMVSTKTFSHLLLGLDPATREGLRFISVHQPAWVAFAAAPASLKLTVLREPIARTVSHLRQLVSSPHTPDDIETIYDDPGWRDRLANYQTQLFADTQERHAAAAPEPVDGDALDDETRAAFHRALTQFWGTAIDRPFAVDDRDRAAAITTLERFDCVGVTDDLGSFADRVAALTGFDLRAVPRANVGQRSHAISDSLLERITADNQHDLALYARARELAGA